MAFVYWAFQRLPRFLASPRLAQELVAGRDTGQGKLREYGFAGAALGHQERGHADRHEVGNGEFERYRINTDPLGAITIGNLG